MIVGNTAYVAANSYKPNEKNTRYMIAQNTINKMKVNASSLNIRSGPDTNYKKIGSLKRGTVIDTIDRYGIWYKIKYKNSYGWCSGDFLLQVDNINDNNTTSNSNQNLSKGDFIIIKTSNNTMAYYKDGVLIKEFNVATGKKSTPTPNGKFKIVNKIVNRPYYKDKIKGGDPRNPLGNRWLGLQVGSTYGTTYAIHGNNSESSIGKSVSAGCVRMHNSDIKWLFDKVPNQTTVIISDSSQSYKQIGTSYNINLQNRLELNSSLF
ncbi:L,D-transpeptidase family protein [Paraclostridium bifermentans]|uniref:L,D-transpeptidase family protein n=1 Tax=Paraclostridium bifermentans TaxID=1490 RepID=A0ABY8QZ18_PARBF|nr:L,D-transpeptidase family protein [Paraclostridium bifermentans]